MRHIQVMAAVLTLALGICACDRSEELPPDLSGVTTERIDASSSEVWAYLDLDAPDAPDQEAGWDVKFQRQFVRVNGEAGVEVATVDGKTITQVETPPDGEYYKDSGEEEGDQAFSRDDLWYDYDISVHKLSPKQRTYVILSDEGAFYKLQFTGYYDDDGESGYPTFYWTAFE